MIFFADTSALIKKYIDEAGSSVVEDSFTSADQIWVSPITKIECTSTIARIFRQGLVTLSHMEDFLNELETDFYDFQIVAFTDELVEASQRLVLKYHLKSLDSIQLASAIQCDPKDITILVSDKKLKNAMGAEGLNSVDPTETD